VNNAMIIIGLSFQFGGFNEHQSLADRDSGSCDYCRLWKPDIGNGRESRAVPLEPIEGTKLSRVILTENAQRIDVQTASVSGARSPMPW
jgi:hypothetical protein